MAPPIIIAIQLAANPDGTVAQNARQLQALIAKMSRRRPSDPPATGTTPTAGAFEPSLTSTVGKVAQ